MEKFGLNQRKAVLESFDLAIEALKKNVENGTKEAKVELTFRQDNNIFVDIKVANDEVDIKLEATIICENNKLIARAKELCETFFAREIERINISRLEIKESKKQQFSIILQNISFSGFMDGAVRNAAYKIVNLSYYNNVGKELPKQVLLLGDISMAKCNGRTYFREDPLSTIYDNYGNVVLCNDNDYEDIESAFAITIGKHHTLKNHKKLNGFVALDFKYGFHIEAKGFNPEENMW